MSEAIPQTSMSISPPISSATPIRNIGWSSTISTRDLPVPSSDLPCVHGRSAKEMPEFKKLAEAGRTEHVSFEVLAQDIPAGSNLEKLLGILKSQGFMVFVVKEADILTDADLGRESWLVQYALGVGKTQFDNVMLQYASIPKPEGFYPIGSYLANEAIRRILDALMATRQTEVAA